MFTAGRQYYPEYRLPMGCVDGMDAAQASERAKERFKLVLVLEGNGLMRIGDRAEYPLAAPALYCFHEREFFRLAAKDRPNVRAVLFHPNVINRKFDFELLRQDDDANGLSVTDSQDRWSLAPFLKRSETDYGCIPLDPATARHLCGIIDELGANLTVQPDMHWPCRSRSCLLELLFLIRRLHANAGGAPEELPVRVPEDLRALIEYIHASYKEKLMLEQLASRFLMNKTTLNRKFKAATGMTVMAYVNRIRMQMAASMLRNTRLSASEIMERIGLKDDAHFIRSFRSYSGLSPAQYRSRCC